ncbi:MAG: acylphosphatase [Bacteroidota bacterium]|nr:acylphosphatase [Bacteroidota bacterium]
MDSQFDIRISGRVQGVGFRAAARRQARLLQLKGWVENLTDGSVRVVIRGKTKRCTRFINWCREGTAYSWVEGVDIRDMEPEPLGSFTIIY